MFKITVELYADTDVDEQCRTIARKFHSAIQDRVKSGPVPVRWEIRASKLTPTSPIIQPTEPMIIQPGVIRPQDKAIHGDSRST